MNDGIGQFRGDEFGIEGLNFPLQKIVEKQAGLTAPERGGLFLGHDGPAGIAGVARERVLDGDGFSSKIGGHGDLGFEIYD